MPKPYTTLRDEVEQELQDVSNAIFTTTEIDQHLKKAFRELSKHRPYKAFEIYFIESRTGTATSTSSGNLVDATNDQFVAEDVGKIVYNTTDRTWAEIDGFTDAETVSLTHDIMAADEEYRIYNPECFSNREIYLGDEANFFGVNGNEAEFRTQRWPRELVDVHILRRNVAELDFDFTPEDSAGADADVRVHIVVLRRHFVSEQTEVTTGAINDASGYQKGDTSITIDGLTGSEVVAEGQELTFAGLRGRYRVTADVTLSTGGGTIVIWPPLEASLANNDGLTMTPSTLDPEDERLVVQLAAGRAAESKAVAVLQESHAAINSALEAASALSVGFISAQAALANLASGDTAADLAPALLLLANNEIDKMAPIVTQALATLDQATGETNAVSIGGPNAPANMISQAKGFLEAVEQHRETALSFLAQASGEDGIVGNYVNLAQARLGSADQAVNQALGYLQVATAQQNTSDRTSEWSAWGRRKVREAIAEMEAGQEANQRFDHPRGRRRIPVKEN